MSETSCREDIRLLHLARQLAEVHISDGDILGKIVQELLHLIDEPYPMIKYLPPDDEGGFILPDNITEEDINAANLKIAADFTRRHRRPNVKLENEK